MGRRWRLGWGIESSIGNGRARRHSVLSQSSCLSHGGRLRRRQGRWRRAVSEQRMMTDGRSMCVALAHATSRHTPKGLCRNATSVLTPAGRDMNIRANAPGWGLLGVRPRCDIYEVHPKLACGRSISHWSVLHASATRGWPIDYADRLRHLDRGGVRFCGGC